jgi:Amylo-alpha-1,6-glucosidase
MSQFFRISIFVLFGFGSVLLQAQIPSLATLHDFIEGSGRAPLAISREVVPNKPFSVIGPRGALLGQQNGTYEAWIFPWKIFSDMRVTAEMQDYPVPIDVNQHATGIDVTPDHTTITYSHANFTVKQMMIAPKETPEHAGVLVFYTIQAVRPITLTFSFEPVMQRMWPADSEGHPSADWVRTAGGSGFYLVEDTFPDHYAALAMPGAEPGMPPPYDENATPWPVQFVLHYDPKRDAGKLFPLLITFADHTQSVSQADAAKRLATLDGAAESIYRMNESYYRGFLAQHTSIDTPDPDLNAAFSWAEASMDQLRVRTQEADKQDALTAGFIASGDSARPGFGWFFGRDALWSLYAVNSYGDFETARQEIAFLLQRQRADGKIMHEWSQTAGLVDWKSLPYEYAAADSTPLLQMAVDDYLKISGDTAFVRANWDALMLAWQFETSHVSADGIYNNQEGSGWVESWVPSMPHQEIYLAALDEQASLAFADLAQTAGHSDLAQAAKQRAAKIGEAIEKEYFLPAAGFYAFSHNTDGSIDDTPTIFPSVAWWDGTSKLDHTDQMFARWASVEFSTDWGTRILSDQVSFYDPISYHQGTVWPLYTGWVSLAEYRAGRTLSAYAHLMQNANLTWAQDLGSVTELLSGQFYQATGRSTAHQLWSSAMVISPVLRGIFGLEWNAASHTLTVTPHLPADWKTATIRHLPFAENNLELTFTRRGQELIVQASGTSAEKILLQSRAAGAKVERGKIERATTEGATSERGTAQDATLRIPLPAAEVAIPAHSPAFGQETQQMKVLNQQDTANEMALTLAAQASSRQTVVLRENAPNKKVHTNDGQIGAAIDGLRTVTIDFPAGEGYVTKTVTFSW